MQVTAIAFVLLERPGLLIMPLTTVLEEKCAWPSRLFPCYAEFSIFKAHSSASQTLVSPLHFHYLASCSTPPNFSNIQHSKILKFQSLVHTCSPVALFPIQV